MSGRQTRRGDPLWPVMPLSAVVARDGPFCVACGQIADTRQHRMNRGMGGSNVAERPSNIIGMCWGCNTLLEQDAAWAQHGRLCGWKLRPTEDPTVVPFWDTHAAAWVRLDDDGGRSIMGSAPGA